MKIIPYRPGKRSHITKSPGNHLGKPWENGDLYGKSPFSIGKSTISGGFTRPGKRLHNELERSTMLLMGTSTNSMVIFLMFFLTRGRIDEGRPC